jgi:hypothetical protein
LETCNTKHLTETCYNAAGPAGTGVVHLHCLVIYGSMPTTTTQKQDNPVGSHQHNVHPSKAWIKWTVSMLSAFGSASPARGCFLNSAGGQASRRQSMGAWPRLS